MNLRATRIVALETAIRSLAAGSGLSDSDVVEVLATIAYDMEDEMDPMGSGDDDLVVGDDAAMPSLLVH